MARIVVWTMPNRIFEDKAYEAKKFQRGMVIDIVSDGLEVGKEIDAADWCRVIEVPGSTGEWSHLMGYDPDYVDSKLFASKSTFPRKRVNMINIDTLEEGLNLQPSDKLILNTKENLSSKTFVATAKTNPDVIGDDPGVIR